MGRGCGGGGLRILPHKSWNTFGHENIERVRRDEAAHAEAQGKIDAKHRQSESEFKLGVMRNMAERRRKRDGAEDDTSESKHADDAEDGDGVEAAEDDRIEDDEADNDRPKPKRARPAASSSAAASSSSAPLRFVVQQESPAVENEHADPDASAALAPAQHFNLFSDVAGSAKQAEMNRIKSSNERKKELDLLKRVAPVSLFVEALKDDSGLMKPWYAASEGERAAMESRERERLKKKVTLKRRPEGGVQILLNPDGSTLR